MKQLLYQTIISLSFFTWGPSKHKNISDTEYEKIAFDSIEFYSHLMAQSCEH